jgi:Carbohydrate-selective porin, OprB family/S-layer homology domain
MIVNPKKLRILTHAWLVSSFVWGNSSVVLAKFVLDASNLKGLGNARAIATNAQIPPASQFSDVRPTDWAFEALQALAERYDCLAGYPDGTYRGNRPLTRYEFAAGLNACLQKIEALLITGDAVRREDLEVLDRLQKDFAAELEGLRDRVDNLDQRLENLESRQFSTTTKLNGLAFLNLTGATAGGDVKVETSNINTPFQIRPAARNSRTNQPIVQVANDPEITFSNLVWLTLSTSFSGKDNLVVQLAAGNGSSPANAYTSAGLYNTFGVPYTDQTGGVDVGTNDVVIRELFYSFPVGDRVQVTVGPRINWYRYFDNNAYTFFLTGTSSFNSIGSPLSNAIDRGSGAIVTWNISDQFRLAIGYLGENNEFLPAQFGFNTASNPAKGLFSATNTTSVELTVSPTDALNLRFFYNYSKIDNNVAIFDENGNRTGFGVGGATGEPLTGVADDGFGGSIQDATAHAFGLNLDWAIAPWLGVFGRYSYGITEINPLTAGRPDGDIRAQSLQLGAAFPDLGKEGALATLSYLIPFSLLDGRNFLVSGGGNGGVQYELEATYFYPLTDNIALVPAFYFIGNPNNFSDNPNIYVGNLRVQFSF